MSEMFNSADIASAIDDLEDDGRREPSDMVLVPREPTEDDIESYVDPDAGKAPSQLRNEGRRYCPMCYTFGHSHRKDCLYKDSGMQYHIAAYEGEKK